MNPAINLIEDIEVLLRSLERSGVTLIEKNREPLNSSIYVPSSEGSSETEDNCRNCGLKKVSKGKAYGTGISKVMFITSWSQYESMDFPVSGEAGELLKRIIKAMNIEPENAYITPLIKCLVPEGDAPAIDDCSFCIANLKEEIRSIKPAVLILLGSFVTGVMLGKEIDFENFEGRFCNWQDFRVMPTFHPEDLIKDVSKKRNVWEAMKKVMALLSNTGDS